VIIVLKSVIFISGNGFMEGINAFLNVLKEINRENEALFVFLISQIIGANL